MSKMHNPRSWKLVRDLELLEEEVEFADLAFVEESEVYFCKDIDEWVEMKGLKKRMSKEVQHVDRG